MPWPRQTLACLRAGDCGQARLRLLRKASENHRNVIAGVLVPSAGDYNPGAMDLSAVARRLQRIDQLLVGDLAWRHANGAVFRVEDAALEQPRCDAFEISPSGPLFTDGV